MQAMHTCCPLCATVSGPWSTLAHLLSAFCRYPSRHVDRTDYEDSTGNLRRHVLVCDPEETPESEMITHYAQGATYSAPRVRFLLAMWCACRHRPFAIVDDPEFRDLLAMLYARVDIPSRHTVSRDVQTIMDDSRSRVLQHFKVCYCFHFDMRTLTNLLLHRNSRGKSTSVWMDGRPQICSRFWVLRHTGTMVARFATSFWTSSSKSATFFYLRRQTLTLSYLRQAYKRA